MKYWTGMMSFILFLTCAGSKIPADRLAINGNESGYECRVEAVDFRSGRMLEENYSMPEWVSIEEAGDDPINTQVSIRVGDEEISGSLRGYNGKILLQLDENFKDMSKYDSPELEEFIDYLRFCVPDPKDCLYLTRKGSGDTNAYRIFFKDPETMKFVEKEYEIPGFIELKEHDKNSGNRDIDILVDNGKTLTGKLSPNGCDLDIHINGISGPMDLKTVIDEIHVKRLLGKSE